MKKTPIRDFSSPMEVSRRAALAGRFDPDPPYAGRPALDREDGAWLQAPRFGRLREALEDGIREGVYRTCDFAAAMKKALDLGRRKTRRERAVKRGVCQ